MNAIEITNLSKTYQTRHATVRAVSNLNLSIPEGCFFSLLGVNGAGKSTAIGMLSGLITPTEGTAAFFGHDIGKERQTARTLIGISPQATAVAGGLTVSENLIFMGGMFGQDNAQSCDRAAQLTQQLGLTALTDRKAATLSGGCQRRLSIAMALMGNPKILFLDEPTLGLDVLARRELWNLISSLRGSVTLVLTTHYMEEAEALSDLVGVLSEGRLKALGSVGQLKAMTGCDRFEDAFVRLVERT